jgi:O-antigen ligase
MPGIKDRFNHQGLVHNERNKINRLTLEIIKEHPITGIGFGMQIYSNEKLVDLKTLKSKLFDDYQRQMIIPSPHNTFLDIAVRTGIIGLVLFFYILFTSLMLIWKILKSTKIEYFKSWAICLFASFMSFFIPAAVADTTFGPRVVVSYTILAMITILWNLVQKEMEKDKENR